MIQLWWKWVRWSATLGVMLLFVVLPLTPIYGWLRPWPPANEKLRADGIRGVPLMIGSGGDSVRRIESSGDYWREEKQRSYIVIPESFHRFEIFTYSELKGSGIEGVQTEVIRSRWLIPVIVLWILAGILTLRRFCGVQR